MEKEVLTARLSMPVSRVELIQNYCRGKAVLDIGCVQHDAENADNANWLHHAIVEVAASTLGIDYIQNEVDKLNARGYNIIAADVTKPLPLEAQFDVIVVGNLIEHLSSFEGLLLNIRRLLRPGGSVLISTANPFYREQYFYTAFKNDIVVNPEHTCWIDPVTLDQLCRRFDLVTHEVHWVREKWKLGQVILHGRKRSFDMFSGKWIFNHPAGPMESALSCALATALNWFAPKGYRERLFARYRTEAGRFLYLKLIEYLFQSFWAVYRLIVVNSRINRYELFVSVLRPLPSR